MGACRIKKVRPDGESYLAISCVRVCGWRGGSDSEAVDVDVELVGDDLGHIEVHTLAVDTLDFDSRGQYNLAFCFQEGLGVGQSDDEAVHWYRLAAELGESAAQCNLGICYDRHCNNGHG